MKILLFYLKPYKWLIALALLLAAINQVFSMLDPYFFGQLIDKYATHPYQFGHLERKETWLWLHNLPPLKPTKDVFSEMMKLPKAQRERIHYMGPSEDRGKERARFFQGWANAMATQWSNL